MVRSQLKRLSVIREWRRKIYAQYCSCTTSKLKLQSGFENRSILPYRFVLYTENRKQRDGFMRQFDNYGVCTIVPVERYELLHRYLKLNASNYPVAEKIVDRTLSVPLYPALNELQIRKIRKVLRGLL